MHVFVSEFLCSGAWNTPPAGSLFREGCAMLSAVVADLVRGGHRVSTTWDSRLGPCRFAGAEIHPCDGPGEQVLFARLAGDADRTLAIAPESDGLLADRFRQVREADGRWCGTALAAIQLCTNKLACHDRLVSCGIPAVPTVAFDPGNAPAAYPAVIKPRDGAGSQLTFRVDSPDQLSAVGEAFIRAGWPAIAQPYVPGRAVSTVVLSDGERFEVLPVGEQQFCDSQRFSYAGGRIPAALSSTARKQIAATAAGVFRAIPGLCGWTGIDLIVPDDGSAPLVVDVNPRLTTSYLGYRRLTTVNLAQRMLGLGNDQPLAWEAGIVHFDCGGAVEAVRSL